MADLLQALREINDGLAVNDIGEAFDEVLDAARDTGKAGTLTVKVKVQPASDNQIMLSASVAASVPKHDRPAGLMFIDEDGSLTRRNPRQQELPFGKDAGATPRITDEAAG